MRLRLSWKYLVAFYALSEVVAELHEQAHITVGRLLAGCYGPRNFSVWQVCAEHPPQPAFLPSLAGPLFSYTVLWLGAWLMLRPERPRRALGLSLLFATLPFARIFTSAMGGGDERTMLGLLGVAPLTARWAALAIVLLVCGTPVLLAARRIAGRRRWAWIAGFCILPLPVIMAVKFKFLNGLLARGVLAEPVWLGTPTLVLAYVGAMAGVLLLSRRWLQAIDADAPVYHHNKENPCPSPTGAC